VSTWSLVTYRVEGAAGDRVGVLTGSTVREVPRELQDAGLFSLLQRWESVRGFVESAEPSDWKVVPGAHLLAPVRFPRKLLGACANYRQHLDQFGALPLAENWRSFFHMTPPTTTVIGPGEQIPMPRHASVQLDWEAELAVVIGRAGRDIPVDRALEHVAGYTIANDISDRGVFKRGDQGPPSLIYDWVSSKGQDGFKPMGPGMVPRHLIPDPQDLRVTLHVNDELKQDYSTSGMTLDVRQLIADASRVLTLEPGDVIMTGSGPGNAWHKGAFLSEGASLRAEIDGIGVLDNVVSAGAGRAN
jgi:2-keto-4-pentenoate hydratase/2-oxohepta-3-ene-1,7-dioic acid hydratase in catechol pathway